MPRSTHSSLFARTGQVDVALAPIACNTPTVLLEQIQHIGFRVEPVACAQGFRGVAVKTAGDAQQVFYLLTAQQWRVGQVVANHAVRLACRMNLCR